jgi:hypothetical protein
MVFVQSVHKNFTPTFTLRNRPWLQAQSLLLVARKGARRISLMKDELHAIDWYLFCNYDE